jgi:hypothetical protein
MQRGQMSDKLYLGWSVYRVETLTAECNAGHGLLEVVSK